MPEIAMIPVRGAVEPVSVSEIAWLQPALAEGMSGKLNFEMGACGFLMKILFVRPIVFTM
jgi:hypothetical protein